MKRLLVAAALAAACWTVAAEPRPEPRPDAKPSPKPIRMMAPMPTYSVRAENEVWLITNLVDDGTRTTISYRIATIEPDGRVVATGRTGAFCVGSARAVADLLCRLELLEDDVCNTPPKPKIDAGARTPPPAK